MGIRYKKIMAAVNEHVNSEISARYALDLARATGSKFYICFIAEKDTAKAALGHAEEAAKRLFLRAQELDICVESIFATGKPVEEIQKMVRSEAIDIVFAATRHKDVSKRFYEGSVALSLSLSLTCSVALVRIVHMGRIHPRKILVPLKARMGHISERAYFTAMLSSAFESSISLFHSAKPITRFFHGELNLTAVEWEKKVPGDMALFIGKLDTYGVAHEKILLAGKTGRNITIEAAARRHDLIIMGASERSLLSSLIKGNPVEEVLRDTPCNLIILKSRHEDS